MDVSMSNARAYSTSVMPEHGRKRLRMMAKQLKQKVHLPSRFLLL